MTHTTAFVYASGEIGFGTKAPGGSLSVLKGPDQKVRDIIAGNARLAYDNQTWLVPGIPEAADQSAAMDALLLFRDRVALRLAQS